MTNYAVNQFEAIDDTVPSAPVSGTMARCSSLCSLRTEDTLGSLISNLSISFSRSKGCERMGGSKTFEDEFGLAVGSALQNVLLDLVVLGGFHVEASFYLREDF